MCSTLLRNVAHSLINILKKILVRNKKKEANAIFKLRKYNQVRQITGKPIHRSVRV